MTYFWIPVLTDDISHDDIFHTHVFRIWSCGRKLYFALTICLV